jgi:hypothetical protein
VAFGDLPALQVFYRASFETTEGDRRLVRFDKFRIEVRTLEGEAPDERLPMAPGYSVVAGEEDEVRMGEPLTIEEALAVGQWIVRTGRRSEEVLKLVRIERQSRTEYRYGGSGEVVSVAIDDSNGSRVITA